MYETMTVNTDGTAAFTGAFRGTKGQVSRQKRIEKRALGFQRAKAVFSGIAILCFVRWFTVMLGSDIGSGIGLEEIVPLLTAMASFAAAALCMIWGGEAQ